MISEEFFTWAKRHCAVFGMTEDEFKTVASWEPYFLASGWHPDDLAEATKALATDPASMVRLAGEARFVGKLPMHQAAIRSWIEENTAREYEKRAATYADTHGTCTLCGGSGYVSVPDLRGVAHGRWVGVKVGGLKPQFATCAVVCPCALGRWKADTLGKPIQGTRGRESPRAMTLESYEQQNPDWRDQVELREEARREKTKLAEPDFERTMADVRSRFKLPSRIDYAAQKRNEEFTKRTRQ